MVNYGVLSQLLTGRRFRVCFGLHKQPFVIKTQLVFQGPINETKAVPEKYRLYIISIRTSV